MPPAKLDPRALRRLIEDEGLTQRETAKRLGCSVSCVERTCARLGVSTQRTGPRGGPLHPDWKGGRTKVGRYWYVWSNTHPFRTRGNYVLEHRLVMERAVRRFLRPGEVVHHINGDPEDNRLENLQLFSSNATHLQHELVGKVPRWTPEGWAAMTRPRGKRCTHQSPTATDDSTHTQSTAHPAATA